MNATPPFGLQPVRLAAYDRECRRVRDRGRFCSGCNGEMDADTCHCGDSLDAHRDPFAMNHMFVPAGCVCYTGVRLCDPRDRGVCSTLTLHNPPRRVILEPGETPYSAVRRVFGRGAYLDVLARIGPAVPPLGIVSRTATDPGVRVYPMVCNPQRHGSCATFAGTRIVGLDRALAHLTSARPVQRQEGMNTDLYNIATGPSVTGGFVGTLTIGVGTPRVTPAFDTEREAFDAALDLALDIARERLSTP